MARMIRLSWKYVVPPPDNGIFSDLKEWVLDTGEKELKDKLSSLLNMTSRNALSFERVNAIADELYALVREHQQEEYLTCKRAGLHTDFESWLDGGYENGNH